MINLVTNNISFTAGSIESSVQRTVKLPAENSIVNIKILDKINSGYKLLIDGSVFQSKLPVNFKINDEVLAAVISTKPFRLSLNNLNGNPALILNAMNLNESKITKEFIKELVIKNKPIEKKKLLRFIEYIENAEYKIDELQIALLAQMYITFPEYLSQFQNEMNDLFKLSFEEIADKIFSIVLQLMAEPNNNEIDKVICSLLTVTEEQLIGKEKFKNKDSEIMQLVQLIHSNQSKGNQLLDELKSNLLYYLLQKSVYNFFNIYPDFIILKNDKVELIHTYAAMNESHNYDLRLKFNSSTASVEIIKAVLSKNRIFIDVYSRQELSKQNIFEKKNILEQMEQKLLLTPYLFFRKPEAEQVKNKYSDDLQYVGQQQ